jgi:NodT family efflux transporter outer membrane factor (OMF) lipoprotein
MPRTTGNLEENARQISKSGIKWLLMLLACSALLMLATGCTMVGPDYVKPDAPVAGRWLDDQSPQIDSLKTEDIDWWQVFKDPILNQLIELAYQQNLDLQSAGIRILQARAQLGITVGAKYPQVQQALLSYERDQLSNNAAGTSPSADLNYDNYNIGLDAAWEVDIWGKFRRSVQSDVANLVASIASYDDVLVSLLAEVALNYVSVRTFEERLAVAQDNVKIQRRSLEITQARFEAGAVTELDVQQAKALLKDTESSIPRFQLGVRQSKNILAFLLSLLPGDVDSILGGSRPIPHAPPEVAVGMPAELLRRRPDIQLAELQLAAQSPRIGVAKSDLYPALQLFGNIGFGTSSSSTTANGGSGFSDWFNGSSLAYAAGAGVSWNIFNYGRIKNAVRLQDARFQQLVSDYENTVLLAYQEVENNMVGFLRKQVESGKLGESVDAYKRAVDLSLLQYREGLVDYQRVLDNQRNLTREQDLFVSSKGEIAQFLISMYKALGGGWQLRVGKDFVPENIKQQMAERTDWGKLLEPEATEVEYTPEELDQWRWPDW